jgi:hypothetical protein
MSEKVAVVVEYSSTRIEVAGRRLCHERMRPVYADGSRGEWQTTRRDPELDQPLPEGVSPQDALEFTWEQPS